MPSPSADKHTTLELKEKLPTSAHDAKNSFDVNFLQHLKTTYSVFPHLVIKPHFIGPITRCYTAALTSMFRSEVHNKAVLKSNASDVVIDSFIALKEISNRITSQDEIITLIIGFIDITHIHTHRPNALRACNYNKSYLHPIFIKLHQIQILLYSVETG